MSRGAARRLAASACALAALLATAGAASAQRVLLDQGVRAGDLWCFPSADDATQWYYVPLTARLATDDAGRPAFAFLRYVVNAPGGDDAGQGITRAGGGGVVTLRATYDTPEAAIRRAERELARRAERAAAAEAGASPASPADRPAPVLRGPVIFASGRYALVSSTLREKGEQDTRVLATGNAPVFEGNEVAFSFDVDADRATLLLESFRMATPDVSIVFEMELEGLSDAYAATVTVDWDRVESSEAFGAELGVYYGVASGAIEQGFEELRKSDAIRIETRGADANMEALLDKVHERLLGMLFRRVEPERIPADESAEEAPGGGGILDSLLGGIEDFREHPGGVAKATSLWSITARYERRETRMSGTTRIDMNHQAPVKRFVTMAANVGDLYRRFGDDPRTFRTVNLADAAYQQREIHVGVDGAILPEFDRYINSVSVTLRKRHQNGAQTVREVVLDRDTFTAANRDLRMIYGWNGDDDREAWLAYDYRTRWSFKGGGLHRTDWQTATTNMIDLYAPYRRSTVELIGDAERLRAQGVRAVSVVVSYDFFEGRRSEEVAVHDLDAVDGTSVELTLPHGVFAYDWEVTWIRRGAPPLTASGRDETGVIFVDELPAEGAAAAAGS